jgi:hypothetical protein
MANKPIPKHRINPLIEIDIDMSDPSAIPTEKRRVQHLRWPDEIEQRWRRIAIAVGAIALVVGIVIGRFLVP